MDRSLVTCIGPFTFNRRDHALKRGDQLIRIGRRGAAILGALADASGEVVTRGDLLEAAWPGLVVEERNLTVQIALLRKAMGDLLEEKSLIRTLPGVGYRLMVEAPHARILELRPSVAVLPFANLTADPDLAFFAHGMTDDVIAALSRFRTFAVMARGSSFARAGQSASVAETAAALGVRYVLEGSVRREGYRLRVAARLSDDAGTVLWADRFEEDLGGVFEMQDRITASVVSHAEPQITRAEIERSRRKQPQSLDAYDHFLQGVAFYHHPSVTSAMRFERMVEHLDRAVALDPSFPQALACAGFAHELRRSFGGTAPAGVDDFAVALDLCDQAEALDGDDPLVLAITAAERHALRDDADGATRGVERAVAKNPHCYIVVDLAATVHMQRDRSDRAIELFQHCLRLSPNSPGEAITLESIAVSHLVAGRFEEAVAWGQRAQALQTGWNTDSVMMTVAYAMLGRLDHARAELERVLAVRPGFSIREVEECRPPRTLTEGDRIWTEGLRRAGLPEG